MNTLLSILEEIRAGTTSFKPISNSESDMRDFQPIAKILVFAHQDGLLESCVPHKESETGHRWYDLVIVRGGLSYKGEMFLTKSPSTSNDTNLAEIVQLKPSIYGVGIDLKALWKRWKQRKG